MALGIDSNKPIEISLDDLRFSVLPLTRGEQLRVVQLLRMDDQPRLVKGDEETDAQFLARASGAILMHTAPENVDKLARFLASKITWMEGVDDIENYLLYGSDSIATLLAIGFKVIEAGRLSEAQRKNLPSSSDMSSPTGDTETAPESADQDDASTSET